MGLLSSSVDTGRWATGIGLFRVVREWCGANTHPPTHSHGHTCTLAAGWHPTCQAHTCTPSDAPASTMALVFFWCTWSCNYWRGQCCPRTICFLIVVLWIYRSGELLVPLVLNTMCLWLSMPFNFLPNSKAPSPAHPGIMKSRIMVIFRATPKDAP